jgi:hypothetical protein
VYYYSRWYYCYINSRVVRSIKLHILNNIITYWQRGQLVFFHVELSKMACTRKNTIRYTIALIVLHVEGLRINKLEYICNYMKQISKYLGNLWVELLTPLVFRFDKSNLLANRPPGYWFLPVQGHPREMLWMRYVKV